MPELLISGQAALLLDSLDHVATMDVSDVRTVAREIQRGVHDIPRQIGEKLEHLLSALIVSRSEVSRVRAALESRHAEASDLAAELRDAIAECLYEHANKDEHGPGGGVGHWREFTDSWVMGAVREVVAAGLASREAEVRRKADETLEKAAAAVDRLYGTLAGGCACPDDPRARRECGYRAGIGASADAVRELIGGEL